MRERLVAGCYAQNHTARHRVTASAWMRMSKRDQDEFRPGPVGEDYFEKIVGQELGVSPIEGCNCGIHASITLDKPLEYLSNDPTVAAIGEVYLWGRVIVNQSGYRAQYAYPKIVTVVNDNTKDEQMLKACLRVERRYGIPCELRSGDDFADRIVDIEIENARREAFTKRTQDQLGK